VEIAPVEVMPEPPVVVTPALKEPEVAVKALVSVVIKLPCNALIVPEALMLFETPMFPLTRTVVALTVVLQLISLLVFTRPSVLVPITSRVFWDVSVEAVSA
jgi:hypothetical protein